MTAVARGSARVGHSGRAAGVLAGGVLLVATAVVADTVDPPPGFTPASWQALSERRPLPEIREGSSLEHYVLHALSGSPGLRAAHDRWRAAMEAIPQAKSLPDPRLSYTYYIQEVETRVGPQRQSVALSQMFPWFGKLRLRGDAAAKEAEVAWLDVQSQRLRLLHQVSVLYHEYCYLRQATEVTEENFELLRGLEAVARERYRTGQSLAAVMQAQVELGKLEDRLRSLAGLRPALSAKLNAVLNRERAHLLPWPALPDAASPGLDAPALLAEMHERNPELGRLAALAEKEGIAAELARQGGYPDITFGVSVVETGGARMPGTRDSGKDPVMATLAINVPLWRDKYRAAQREALFRQSAFLEQRQERGNDLEADIALALHYYEDATRKVALYRDTLLPKARQALGVAQQGFQTGKAGFLEVIDAQRALLEFRLEVAKAQAEQGKRFAEIRMLTGAGGLHEPPPE